MQYLDQALMEYTDTDMYPFHMPGHKRRELPFANPYHIDITEIQGFDNLYHAEGILLEAQARAARLYGSDRCFYLVNGSTCGLLAAICAATAKRDKVLVARNSHKAVYHTLYINQLSAEYLYPVMTENDLQGQITPEQVEKAFAVHPDIAAVIVTSPTYEGIVSDIDGIAAVCHAKGVPLIVDSAHGAHLGFGHGFLENAVRLGADAVIMSLHKTLPSFTQTALLHLNGERISEEKVRRYLGIFETSSPSYLFMAGMDACVRLLEERRGELFSDYRKLLLDFYRNTDDLKKLHVMRAADLKEDDAYGWDDSKLVIFTGMSGLTGEQLDQLLRERYHLQMEMVSGEYVLGMTSIMDRKEGLDRLAAALHEIDVNPMQDWVGKKVEKNKVSKEPAEQKEKEEPAEPKEQVVQKDFIRRMYTKNCREMEIYQAMDLPCREVSFEEAAGGMSADYIYLYPPGIPMLVPGEIITSEFIVKIEECMDRKLRVEGAPNLSFGRIHVVDF